MVLADKGFLIEELLPEGVVCNIPPFLANPQFTPNEVALTRNIVKARIHVERAIERLKRFHILNSIESTDRHYADVILSANFEFFFQVIMYYWPFYVRLI